MSKKTDNIYRSLETLDELNEQLKQFCCYGSADNDGHPLENIAFEMGQQLKNLRFWFDSLYCFNGKSTSRAKKAASKVNGQKGGRPPKGISDAKKRLAQLEQIEIPEIEHSLKMSDDEQLLQALQGRLENAQTEAGHLNTQIAEYFTRKANSQGENK